MSNTRYEVTAARGYTDRDGNAKTAWTRIGTMFPMRERDGFTITFDAMPIPQMNKDGVLEVRVMALPPKPREDNRQGGRPPAGDDQDIPFAPEF